MMAFEKTNLRKRLLGQVNYLEGAQSNKRHNTCPPDFQYSTDLELASAAPVSLQASSQTIESLNLMQTRTKPTEPTIKSISEEDNRVGALGMDVDKNGHIDLEEREALSKTAKALDRPSGQKVLVFGFQKDCSKCQQALPGHYSHIIYRE